MLCRSAGCDRRRSARGPVVRGERPRRTSANWIRRPAASWRGRSRHGNSWPGRSISSSRRWSNVRWKARRVLFIGAGREEAFTPDLARKTARPPAHWRRGSAGRPAWRFSFVPALPDPSGDVDVAGFFQSAAEGLTLAEFDGGSYKTAEAGIGPAPRLALAIGHDRGFVAGERRVDWKAAVARGRMLGECSNLARELANEPGNTLTPREFADRASNIVSERRRGGRDPRREADRGARHGAAARRRPRQQRAAAPDGVPARSARRRARRAGARPGRQRASRSTPAAFRSSRPTAWTG